MKNILIACEESQAVTIAFRKRGFNAYSCDILPCSGDYPEFHMQDDVRYVINDFWDLIISFQPCTHTATSGAKHFEQKRADGRQEAGIRFFFEIWKKSNCSENPIGILNGGKYISIHFPELYTEMLNAGFPFKCSQIIQPWYFGDSAQKSTCLWLRGLPELTHTHTSLILGNFTFPRKVKNYLNGIAIINRVKTGLKLFQVSPMQWPINGVNFF